MALPQDFWDRLPTRSDRELLDMLAHPEDYLPEARDALAAELEKRNIAPEVRVELQTQSQASKHQEDAKASERLGIGLRIFIVIFCFGLTGVLLAVYYDSKGCKQKARDCWMMLALSLALHFLLGILLPFIY